MPWDTSRYYSADTNPIIPADLGRLPSVTTITDCYPKPWMFAWAKKLGVGLFVDAKAHARHLGGHSFNRVYGKRGISRAGHKNRLYLVRKHFHGFDRILRLFAVHALDFIRGGLLRYSVKNASGNNPSG